MNIPGQGYKQKGILEIYKVDMNSFMTDTKYPPYQI